VRPLEELTEHEELRLTRMMLRRTQRAVAIEVGIAPGVLSDFELGYRALPPEVVHRLREALGLEAA
jgi:transcriptional regulator with XRE-family HTH domain